MTMAGWQNQQGFLLILKANATQPCKVAVTVVSKDTFVCSWKEIVGLKVKEIVPWSPKYAHLTIIRCVVVMELPMGTPAVLHQWEFLLILKANVVHDHKAAVTVRTKDTSVCYLKEIVGLEAKEIVPWSPKYARWIVLQCVVVMGLPMAMPAALQHQQEFPLIMNANDVDTTLQ
jgi:hypothetical protein